MLDVGQWEFWVVRADAVRTAGFKTVGIAWVRDHASEGPVRFDELAPPIASCR